MRSRCAIVYMNLGPYHIARLRALTRVLPDVRAIEVAGKQQLYPWRPARDAPDFRLTTLFPDRACETVSSRRQREAVTAELSALDPAAVIVAGYREPVMRAAAGWAREHGIPTVLQFVSTRNDRPRTWWRETLKSCLVTRYNAVAATGRRAEDYAVRLGAKKERIHRVGNVVDNEYYAACGESVDRDRSREQTRRGLPARYFLTVSRLSSEKNLSRLLAAFSQYRRNAGRWDLVLVGSGPQQEQLRAEVERLRAPGVHFAGWRSHEELPGYYALASCFILPSISEPWGLVVNEAMACGLPVLVSRNCGCVPELCRDGENGYSFDPCSVDQLAELMRRMSSNDGQLAAFGEASRRIVASFTPQTWAQGLKQCITAAVEGNGRCPRS